MVSVPIGDKQEIRDYMSAQGQGQGGDSSTDVILVLIVLGIGLFLISHFYGNDITRIHVFIRLHLVQFYKMIPWIGNAEVLSAAERVMIIKTANEWDLDELGKLSGAIRGYIVIPFALIFVGYAYYIWNKNPMNRFCRKLNRQSLLDSESRQWPWVVPILKLDLTNASILEGPWAMAKPPVEFSKKFRLLNPDKTLNRARAEKLFASQLGNLWDSPDKLPNYVKALLACFMAQACRDKDAATEGLKALAIGMAAKSVDYTWVDPLLKKYINEPIIQAAIARSAYTSTLLCTILEAGRKNGVLPPNYFLWLRPVNRSLWYALNGVGRRTPFSEVAGIHAHFLAEKVAGKAMERPYIIKAVDALEGALKEIIF